MKVKVNISKPSLLLLKEIVLLLKFTIKKFLKIYKNI